MAREDTAEPREGCSGRKIKKNKQRVMTREDQSDPDQAGEIADAAQRPETES